VQTKNAGHLRLRFSFLYTWVTWGDVRR